MENLSKTFPTWKSYGDAFTECLSTCDYNHKFLDYADLTYQFHDADVLIVRQLLALGYDAQEGFDVFMNACMSGPRYLKQAVDSRIVYDIIRLFLDHGATVGNQLFKKLVSSPGYPNPEDNEPFLEANALLIKELADNGVVLSHDTLV